MRKPEEIMSDADNRPSIKILGMMEYDSAIKAIKQAQKEAYNEAIKDAANVALCERTGFGHDHLTGNVSKESILNLLIP